MRSTAVAALLFAATTTAHAQEMLRVTDLAVTPADGAGDVAGNAALLVAAPPMFALPSFTAALLDDDDGGAQLQVDVVRGSELAVVSLPVPLGATARVQIKGADGSSRTVSFTPGAALLEDAPAAPSDATLAPIDPCFPDERIVQVAPPAGAVALVLVPITNGVEGPGHAVLVDGNVGADGLVSLEDQVTDGGNPDYEVIAVDAAGQESLPFVLGAPAGDPCDSPLGCSNAGGLAGSACPAFLLAALLLRRRAATRR